MFVLLKIYTCFRNKGERNIIIKVVSVDNMRKSDSYAIAHTTPALTLVERAGRAIFEAVKWKAPIAIVCGTGNNAADGFVVAELLRNDGKDCTIFLLSDKFSAEGQHFFDECTALGVPVRRGLEEFRLDGYKTVLDCIFGTGFRGEVEDPYRTAIERINASDAYTVSCDINSGLGGDSGLAALCVKSDLTVSIGSYKSGLFLNSA